MDGEDLDDLLQRLAVARYALDAADVAAASEAIDAALALARRLATDSWVTGDGGDSLLRTRATPD